MNKVIIENREYEMYLSVRATKEVAKLCTDGKFENFERDLNDSNDIEKFELLSGVCVALNKAAIQRRRYENGEPMGDFDKIDEGLTSDMIDAMDPLFFVSEVYPVALATLMGDSTTDVEVEPEKNAKKPVKKSK